MTVLKAGKRRPRNASWIENKIPPCYSGIGTGLMEFFGFFSIKKEMNYV
jgi:hypothetical protein